jgi:hypothetical protein
MAAFRQEVWDKELGRGGIIGDLSDLDRSQIPVITTGALRRFVPVWENRKYASPCEASCPSGIPVQDRWRLVARGGWTRPWICPWPTRLSRRRCAGICAPISA